jgi:hypothetical protein
VEEYYGVSENILVDKSTPLSLSPLVLSTIEEIGRREVDGGVEQLLKPPHF